MQCSQFAGVVFSQGVQAGKGPAPQVGDVLGVREARLQPIRDALQEPIAAVPAERVVDDTQVRDVEHGHRKTRRTAAAARL